MKATYKRELRLNIRKQPTINSEVVGQMKKGDAIDVKDEENGWYQVKGGYVMAKYLETDGEDVEEAPEVEKATDVADETDGEETAEGGELENMSVADLKKLAQQSGVKVSKSFKKADIIAAILADDDE